MKEEKNKVGRPTKLTPELIKVLKEVVDYALYFTDEDLVDELNERLEKDQQIVYGTFRAYKAGNRQENSPLIDEFVTLIKKALRKEKTALLVKLELGVNQWQSKAWILERKFTEWNLRHITEADVNLNKTQEIKVNTEEEKEQIDKWLKDL